MAPLIWLALALPASAGPQSDLVACFQALAPYTSGRGTDIGGFEEAWTGARRPTLVVRDIIDGREALRFYTDDSAFLYRLPPDPNRANVHTWLLEIHIPDRSTIRCEYMVEDDPSDPGMFQCGVENVPKGAKSISPKRIMSDQTSTWPLKAAVLERLDNAAGRYSAALARYRKALDDYKNDQATPSWASYIRGSLGVPPPPPNPPSEIAFISTLRPCALADDENVRNEADGLMTYGRISAP